VSNLVKINPFNTQMNPGRKTLCKVNSERREVMSRKLLLAAVISFALVGTGFAAVENIKVSGDITSQAISRNLALDSKDDTLTDTKDGEDFLFSQVRLRFDADLTENVSAVIRLINERLWGHEDDSYGDTEVDLDLGYLEMKEFLYEPLTLIIGRQELRYGNALLIGDPDTNMMATAAKVPSAFSDLSLRKSMDAIRAILDYSPYTVDLVYIKIREIGSAGVTGTNARDDITILGANVAYQWADYNGLTEGYFYGAELVNAAGQVGEDQDKLYTVGGRAQWDPNDHWTVGVEGAFQFGDAHASTIISPMMYDQPREAYAAQAGANYRFLNDYNAQLGINYTFLSGDNNQDDGEWNQWDPLLEDQTPGEIINLLLPNTNAHFIQVTGSMMPREDVTLGLIYAHARMVEAYDGDLTSPFTYSPSAVDNSNSPATNNTYAVDRDNNHVGDEIDVYAIYDYTEDVQLKLISATFLPGGFFSGENNGTAYSLRGSVSVLF
jgi:hypothetical protein